MVVAAIAAAWVVEALVLGLVMRRRGFDGYTWTTLGIGFGPIAVLVAVFTTVPPPPADPSLLFRGRWSSGPIDVLVGLDGSGASDAALRGAADVFGPIVGRLTAAIVVPIDAGPAAMEVAEEDLGALRDRYAGRLSGVVLRGRPEVALREYAEDEGYDLLAVGTRGRGLSRSLLGSVATGLAQGEGRGSVPVVLFSGDDAVEEPAASSPAAFELVERITPGPVAPSVVSPS